MSSLLACNPRLEKKRGFYQDPNRNYTETEMSAELLRLVGDVFDQAKSKSAFSPLFESELFTPELVGALSGKPIQFLHALDLTGVPTALDLTNDYGGIAHFLAGKVKRLETVKSDPQKARLATRRTSEIDNVNVVLEAVEQLHFPPNTYDLIVLGEFDQLALEKKSLIRLLKQLQQALTPAGVLVINAQNTARLSTFYGRAPQLHVDGPDFADLYQFEAGSLNDAVTPSATTLASMRRFLLNLGFGSVRAHATFSQGDDFSNLFSEDYLATCVDPLNHFYRIRTLDRDDLSEYLLYRQLHRNKQPLVDLASRYLFVLGSDDSVTDALIPTEFMHFAGSSRKPEWRAHTFKTKGSHDVTKQAIASNDAQTSALIAQDTSDQPFQKGALLVNDWLDCILENDAEGLSQEVREYHAWLNQLAADSSEFQRVAYDALPFNVLATVKKDQRRLTLIDTEWGLKEHFDADFVAFRALFWFAFENQTLLKRFATQHATHSLEAFIARFMPRTVSYEEIREWAHLEERVQAEISASFTAGSVTLTLGRAFDADWQIEADTTYAELMWLNAAYAVDRSSTALCDVQKAAGEQTLKFSASGRAPTFDRLRLDPVATAGCFSIDRVVIIDAQGATLDTWDAHHLVQKSEQHNVRVVADGAEAKPLWIALNDDPHFILDLKEEVLKEIAHVELSLSWHWDERYSTVMRSLTRALSDRDHKLQQLTHRVSLLEYEGEYLHSQIGYLSDHNRSLKQVMGVDEQGSFFRGELEAQRQKNDELYSLLLTRPSTRLKAFISRAIHRVLRRPYHEPDPDIFKAPPPPPKPPKLSDLIGQNTEDYALWMSENDLNADELAAARAEIESMPHKPVFSILVPVYNTPPEYLIPMIRSVQAQIYPHWQLCLVDDCSPDTFLRYLLQDEAAKDPRISILLNSTNHGISATTNDALEMATGDYIALLDHDDEISVDALYQNAKVINEVGNIGLIYSDEDKMDLEGNRLEPCFKPDYSPDLLYSNNYICHLTVIERGVMDAIGGFREGLDGSQDHDVILRAVAESQARAKVIHHIPRILYHWRKIPGSTAVEYDSKSYAWEAGRKSVEDCLRKNEPDAAVEFGSLKGSYRVVRPIDESPRVSIIIPFRDRADLLSQCVASVLRKTTYPNIEIVGVNNQSVEQETLDLMASLSAEHDAVRFVDHDAPFNFSAICNTGVAVATGEYVLLLNNDIEIINADWIERLLEQAQRPEVGAVGGKLLYPDGRIQHAGIVVGMVGAAGHPHKFFPDRHIGYHGRLHMVYNVSAVTGAMLMVKREKFQEVGGLDEDALAVAYNDVDFCLKLLDKGYYNVFTPHAQATHHESLSRGYEDTPEKLARLKTEQAAFLSRWAEFIKSGDPFYNPNLSLKKENFSLKFRDS